VAILASCIFGLFLAEAKISEDIDIRWWLRSLYANWLEAIACMYPYTCALSYLISFNITEYTS